MKVRYIECKTRRTAWRRCPWAAAIVRVHDGFLCFVSWDDYALWYRQR